MTIDTHTHADLLAWNARQKQDYSHTQDQTRRPELKTVRPKYTPYKACSNPAHKALFCWDFDCFADICLWCNQDLANNESRLILDYLHPDARTCAERLIKEAGLEMERFS